MFGQLLNNFWTTFRKYINWFSITILKLLWYQWTSNQWLNFICIYSYNPKLHIKYKINTNLSELIIYSNYKNKKNII